MAQLSDDCFAFGGPMMSVGEAVGLIAARVTPVVDVETVTLARADGRVTNCLDETGARIGGNRQHVIEQGINVGSDFRKRLSERGVNKFRGSASHDISIRLKIVVSRVDSSSSSST